MNLAFAKHFMEHLSGNVQHKSKLIQSFPHTAMLVSTVHNGRMAVQTKVFYQRAANELMVMGTASW